MSALASAGAPTGAPRPGTVDEVVARLERLPFSRFHLHLAGVLGVGTFFDAFDSLAIASALPVLVPLLRINSVQAGYIVSAGFLGAMVGAFIIGYLSELFGRKFAFIFSLILFGACTAAVAAAPSFEIIVVLRVLQGIGLGGEVPVAAAMLNEFLRSQSRGRISATYQSLFAWGSILTPSLALVFYSLFGQAIGWRVIFLFGGIPVLVGLYAIARLPESPRWLADKGRAVEANAVMMRIETGYDLSRLDRPQPRQLAESKPTRFGELFSSAYWRRTALIWTQFFMFAVVSNTLGGWLPTVYAQVGQVSTEFALALTIAGSVLTLVTAYVFAALTDHVGRKPLFVLGFGVSCLGALAGLAMVVGFHATGWPVLFATAALLQIGAGIHLHGVYLYTAELFPTRMRSWAISTGQGMSRLAGVIGPLLLGILLSSVFGIGGVYSMFLLVSLIGLAVMLALGIETKQRALEELSV